MKNRKDSGRIVAMSQQNARKRSSAAVQFAEHVGTSSSEDESVRYSQPRRKSSTTDDHQPRKRGRAPSKRPCLNKNALMARENRQRKKEYIQKIEQKLQQYQAENRQLNSTIKKQAHQIKKLTSEVTYLKNVLNNSTVITSLLKAMNQSLSSMHSGSSCSGILQNHQDDDFDRGGNPGTSSHHQTNSNSMERSGATSNQQDHSYSSSSPECNSNLNYDPQGDEDDILDAIKASPSSRSTLSEYNNLDGEDLQSPLLGVNNADFSDSNFSQFDVDLFSNLDKLENPLQFDEESFLDTLDESNGLFYENGAQDLGKVAMGGAFDGAGVCLHVNSNRVSLEFCATCHFNSIKTEQLAV